jgi:hypothetical protein
MGRWLIEMIGCVPLKGMESIPDDGSGKILSR